ncbi:MAG: hypothetical protein V7700_14500 [Halioglobus sp.]
MIITTALILVLASGYWLMKLGKRAAAKPTPAGRPANRSGKYHAVSINSGHGCCSAAKALRSKRFLTMGKVPSLPVANCTSASCTCGYVRHEDRRSAQGDRRAVYSMQSELYDLDGAQNRRAKRGRRTLDWSHDAAADSSLRDIQWTT